MNVVINRTLSLFTSLVSGWQATVMEERITENQNHKQEPLITASVAFEGP